MTLAELGIDEATWTKALTVIDHPWRPGQRCESGGIPKSIVGICFVCLAQNVSNPHDIPMPEPTDALLMAMLLEGWRRNKWFLVELGINLGNVNQHTPHEVKRFQAAIIRATASLQ